MVVPKTDGTMKDSPGSKASATSTGTIAAAEVELAATLRDGLCADPFGYLGPHRGTKPGHFRMRVYMPGSDAVTILARETRQILARLQAVDGSNLFTGDVTLSQRGQYLLQVESALGQR